MTREEFAAVVEKGLKERVANVLRKEFRHQTHDIADDNTQSALCLAASKVEIFTNEDHVLAWTTATAKNIAMRRFTQESEHKKKLGMYPTPYHKRDSQSRLDFEIDVEMAIKRNVRYFPMQAACWRVIVEGFSIEDILARFPNSVRSRATWRNSVRECLKAVRADMREGGYGKR